MTGLAQSQGCKIMVSEAAQARNDFALPLIYAPGQAQPHLKRSETGRSFYRHVSLTSHPATE